jgi:Homeobox KN domain
LILTMEASMSCFDSIMDVDTAFADPFEDAGNHGNAGFLPLLDCPPDAPANSGASKRPVFDFTSDYGDLDDPSTANSDAFSWPAQDDEADDIATELLSIPSFDNVLLSRTTSLDDCLLPSSSQAFNTFNTPSDPLLGRAKSTSSKPFRIPDAAKALLDSWFSVNINDPYLKAGDSNAFAHLTGLSEQQVKTYIANRRSRKLGGAALEGGTMPLPARPDSQVSLQSVPSTASLSRRRGRRRFRTSSDSLVSQTPSNPNRIYHCTFASCSSDFARKGDWKRHEQSSHMPQEEWICLLTPPIISADSGSLLCGFCGTEQVSEEHLEGVHRYSDCATKDEVERTFARKDKLGQHLVQVHSVERTTANVATNWRRQVNRDRVYVCGFCGESCEDWNKRVDHIAGHFEAGLDISLWVYDVS